MQLSELLRDNNADTIQDVWEELISQLRRSAEKAIKFAKAIEANPALIAKFESSYSNDPGWIYVRALDNSHKHDIKLPSQYIEAAVSFGERGFGLGPNCGAATFIGCISNGRVLPDMRVWTDENARIKRIDFLNDEQKLVDFEYFRSRIVLRNVERIRDGKARSKPEVAFVPSSLDGMKIETGDPIQLAEAGLASLERFMKQVGIS
jgi:hypothetical protein